MHRRWFASLVLVLLMFIALWSSSLIVGEPAQQANATEQSAAQTLLHQAQTQLAYSARLVTEAATESGVYVAYFLQVPDGVSKEMGFIREILTERYGWHIEEISSSTLANREIDFDTSATTAEVLVIAGGSTPLSEMELAALQEYVGNGGNLIIFAGTNLNDEQTSLASADNLNEWLHHNFGVHFNNDVVLDMTHAFQSPLLPVTTDFNNDIFITTNGIDLDHRAAIMEVPNSLTISESPPSDVLVGALLWSSAESYSKTDLEAVLNSEIDQEEEDTQGPLVLAAFAEVQSTQSRIILFGSTSLGTEPFASFQGVDNAALAFNSFIWTTRYDEYFSYVVEHRAMATTQASGGNRATIAPSATPSK